MADASALQRSPFITVSPLTLTSQVVAPASSVASNSSAPPMTSVTVLFGGSSVGKTSIIKAFCSANPETVESGPDMLGPQLIIEEFLEKQTIVAPEDYAHLKACLVPRENDWHLHDAISGDVFDFKAHVSEQDQKRAMATASQLHEPTIRYANEVAGKNINQKLLDRLLGFSKSGKSSVCDMIGVDELDQHAISKSNFIKIKKVLVYCPFAEVVERMDKRNRKALENGEYNEIRTGIGPLQQFAELFGARKPGDTDQDVVGIISKNMALEIFDKAFFIWNDYQKIPKHEGCEKAEQDKMQKCLLTYKQDKEKFLVDLGFSPADGLDKEIEMTPRAKYDMHVNTSHPGFGIGTPAEKARNIADTVAAFSGTALPSDVVEKLV